jgi:hypothetical protein
MSDPGIDVVIADVRLFAHGANRVFAGGWVRMERPNDPRGPRAVVLVPHETRLIDWITEATEAKGTGARLTVPAGFFEASDDERFSALWQEVEARSLT